MRPRFAAKQEGLEFGIAVRDSPQEFQPAWGATVVTTYISSTAAAWVCSGPRVFATIASGRWKSGSASAYLHCAR